MNVIYIAPVFKPAIGGGVVYLDMLSQYCINSGCVDSFVIITERFTGQPIQEVTNGGKLTVFRYFPFRAGRSKKDLFSYVQYLWQNLQFLLVYKRIEKYKPDVVFVHSSFHNHKNLLHYGLKILKLTNVNVKLISDVRDPKLPENRFKELKLYDKIISCSENVSRYLATDSFIKKRMITIPVPITPLVVNDNKIAQVVTKFNLPVGSYLFNGSGCSKEKGILASIELVRQLRKLGYKYTLVVAGKKRYWDDILDSAEKEGWFHFVGEICHEEVIILSCGAWLDINLSSVDSMPRHSLEAMSAGARVLLPPGVPEFDQDCSDFVAYKNTVPYLVEKVMYISGDDMKLCNYDWKRHLPENVFPAYSRLFISLRE